MSLPGRPLVLARLAAPVLVVAPHPDDESLHCGGLIARLRALRRGVHVLVVTDGGASHPGSCDWPPPRLAALRRREVDAALAVLGVPQRCRHFLDLPDTRTPQRHEDGFAPAAARVAALLRRHRIRTVISPWRHDPHHDHRAAAALVEAALVGAGGIGRIRRLEYPGWTGILAAEQRRTAGGRRVWRLALGRSRGLKHRAVACHRSQSGRLIRDDPAGFVLDDRLRRRFERPVELFWEVVR